MKLPSLALLPFILACVHPAAAAVFSLEDLRINIDGVVAHPLDLGPTGVDSSGFDFAAGSGSLTISVFGAGSHFIGVFADLDIDDEINGFFNEHGFQTGSRPAGLSWEIDEPGFAGGDVFDHFSGSSAAGSLLENASQVAADAPNDVSLALGWSFVLNTGQAARISFLLGERIPRDGFFLTHADQESGAAAYLSSTARVEDVATPVPDGASTLTFLMVSLASIASFAIRRNGGRLTLFV